MIKQEEISDKEIIKLIEYLDNAPMPMEDRKLWEEGDSIREMTKQEEILKWLAIELRGRFLLIRHEVAVEEWKTYHKKGKEAYLRDALWILSYLHSQGLRLPNGEALIEEEK